MNNTGSHQNISHKTVANIAGSFRHVGIVMLVLCPMFSCGCHRQSPQEVSQDTKGPSKNMPLAEERLNKAPHKKVLLVHSYHKEYEWVAQITRGVKRSFENSDVDYEVFYMDTKRRSDEAWKQQAGREAANVVETWNPDVVIAVDDNAQKYFAKQYAGKDRPQIVFCGVNADPADYGYPAKNVTGILERPYYAATLNMFKAIVPKARRIAVISDNSPTSAGAIEYMRQQKPLLEVVSWEMPDTFREWKAAVLRSQDSADAIVTYMYHTVKLNGSLKSMEPRDVMKWTVENSKIPLLGFFVFTIDDGGLCGMVESGVEHGWEAGMIALGILAGKKASDYPIKTARHGQSMLNLETAATLDIRIPESVLKNTDIVNEEKNAVSNSNNP